MIRSLLLLLVLTMHVVVTMAQIPDQPNIDFESGTTSVWSYYLGKCCPLVLDTPTVALPDRHEITSGSGLDMYGKFPIVSPGGGSYSMKLGNNNISGQAERAEYMVHIPPGMSDYSLIFRYAVVFEDPGHEPDQQPRFAVNAWDSATDNPVECAQYLYVASSQLPGFDSLPDIRVKFKGWTTASINLSGYQGKTIKVQFTTGDCGYGGHFGYAYIDISRELFAISQPVCNKRIATLKGPEGFSDYYWYDAGFNKMVGAGKYATVPNPVDSQTYAVILVPYPGYGCPDTLYTTIYPSQLDMTLTGDDGVCKGRKFSFEATGEGGDGPLSYLWTKNGITECQCGVVSGTVENKTTYIIRISDTSGCNISDTVVLNGDDCVLTIPNAFTPNDDGKNDVFRVIGEGLDNYRSFRLLVFNRYGERVFYTQDIYEGWDGVYNGEFQNMNVFFYMVQFTLRGKEYLLKGDVTLVR